MPLAASAAARPDHQPPTAPAIAPIAVPTGPASEPMAAPAAAPATPPTPSPIFSLRPTFCCSFAITTTSGAARLRAAASGSRALVVHLDDEWRDSRGEGGVRKRWTG